MSDQVKKSGTCTQPHGDEGLNRLRRRLWLWSSLLTCAILMLALGSAWVASVLSARNGSNGALRSVERDAMSRVELLAAHDEAQPSVREAFDTAVALEQKGAGGWKPTALAPDTYYSVSAPIESPFSLAVFEDGSMAFLVRPLNVQAGDGHPRWGMNWCETTLEQVVDEARALRADAGNRPGPQYIEVAGITWKCVTSIAVTNPLYNDDATGDSGVTLYADGRLEGYEKDGYLAARLYSFVDVTPTFVYLKKMAVFLGASAAIGSVLLVVVCRKIVDRALVPVAESQARQREFLIKASHELKTPMASLSSNLDALMANADESVASQEQWTGNMRADIDELADRTCRLLDLVADPACGDSKV